MISGNEIQEKIKEAIKRSDLSQSEIARRLNIRQQSVYEYISGKTLPSLETFANLCKILDEDANEILCLN